MNELKVFENPEFGRVRTVSVDNEPWFSPRTYVTHSVLQPIMFASLLMKMK